MDTLKQEIEKYSYNFEKDYNEFLIATEFSSMEHTLQKQ